MSLLNLWKRKKAPAPASASIDQGILVFANTSEVIRAESILITQCGK